MLLNLLLGLLILIAVAMTAVILLQRSEGGGLVSGGGGQLMTARGAGNLLTKTTQILGAAFFLLALAITILTGREAGSGSITDKINIQAIDPNELKAKMNPGAPPATTAPADSGLTSGFISQEPTIDQAPTAPATPAAP